METAQRRLATTVAHLVQTGNETDPTLRASQCSGEINGHALNTILFDHLEYRHQVFEFLKDPFFVPRYELGIAGKFSKQILFKY
jgi:hypothetical protein